MHPSLMNIALTIPTLLSVVSGLPLVALEEAGSGKPTASPGGVQVRPHPHLKPAECINTLKVNYLDRNRCENTYRS